MGNEVPSDAMLCRFIRDGEWSETEKRPKTDLFTEPAWSVWHADMLAHHSVDLDQLRIGALAGSGKLLLTAGDYRRFAANAERERGGVRLPLRIAWRTGDDHVREAWKQWAYAHVEIDITVPINGTVRAVLVLFRRFLTVEAKERARRLVPPDKFVEPGVSTRE